MAHRHQNRDVVLDGTKSSDGQSTTVWQHAQFAWRCRDLLLEFARLSDAYMDALDSVRQDNKAVRKCVRILQSRCALLKCRLTWICVLDTFRRTKQEGLRGKTP